GSPGGTRVPRGRSGGRRTAGHRRRVDRHDRHRGWNRSAPRSGQRRDRRGIGVRPLEPAGARGERPAVGLDMDAGDGGAGERRDAGMSPSLVASIDWVAWVLLVARVGVIFVLLLIAVMLTIWLERKFVAD